MEFKDAQFKSYLVRTKQFEKYKHEIDEDEKIIALSLTETSSWDNRGIVVVTDKRILIRPGSPLMRGNFDILYQDIEIDSLKLHKIRGIIEFKSKGKTYHIFDPSKPVIQQYTKLTNIIKEKIENIQNINYDSNKLNSEKLPNFCPECGNKIVINSKFCPECGYKL